MFRYSLEDSLNRFVAPNESTKLIIKNTILMLYILLILLVLINKDYKNNLILLVMNIID